jgi:branched-chain amino acid transport system ATP-binding protein
VTTVPLRLEALGVSVHFAGIKAVENVDLDIEEGEILGLIGPNGAGKTTLVNALSGFQRPTAGAVWIGGIETTDWKPDRCARHGVSRTFQGARLFGALSVRENVEVAALAAGHNPSGAARRGDELLELFALTGVADQPRLLLIDEPAAGLNEDESDELLEVLASIRAQLGCGLLVIEHDMRLVMRLCDRLQVLDHGRTIFIGAPIEAQRAEAVLEAYLGATWAGEDARSS